MMSGAPSDDDEQEGLCSSGSFTSGGGGSSSSGSSSLRNNDRSKKSYMISSKEWKWLAAVAVVLLLFDVVVHQTSIVGILETSPARRLYRQYNQKYGVQNLDHRFQNLGRVRHLFTEDLCYWDVDILCDHKVPPHLVTEISDYYYHKGNLLVLSLLSRMNLSDTASFVCDEYQYRNQDILSELLRFNLTESDLFVCDMKKTLSRFRDAMSDYGIIHDPTDYGNNDSDAAVSSLLRRLGTLTARCRDDGDNQNSNDNNNNITNNKITTADQLMFVRLMFQSWREMGIRSKYDSWVARRVEMSESEIRNMMIFYTTMILDATEKLIMYNPYNVSIFHNNNINWTRIEMIRMMILSLSWINDELDILRWMDTGGVFFKSFQRIGLQVLGEMVDNELLANNCTTTATSEITTAGTKIILNARKRSLSSSQSLGVYHDVSNVIDTHQIFNHIYNYDVSDCMSDQYEKQFFITDMCMAAMKELPSLVEFIDNMSQCPSPYKLFVLLLKLSYTGAVVILYYLFREKERWKKIMDGKRRIMQAQVGNDQELPERQMPLLHAVLGQEKADAPIKHRAARRILQNWDSKKYALQQVRSQILLFRIVMTSASTFCLSFGIGHYLLHRGCPNAIYIRSAYAVLVLVVISYKIPTHDDGDDDGDDLHRQHDDDDDIILLESSPDSALAHNGRVRNRKAGSLKISDSDRKAIVAEILAELNK